MSAKIPDRPYVAASSSREGPDSSRERHATRHGHGHGHGHGWMMMICCIPMLVIAVALVATGAGGGFLVPALLCTAMMAAMMFMVPGGRS